MKLTAPLLYSDAGMVTQAICGAGVHRRDGQDWSQPRRGALGWKPGQCVGHSWPEAPFTTREYFRRAVRIPAEDRQAKGLSEHIQCASLIAAIGSALDEERGFPP